MPVLGIEFWDRSSVKLESKVRLDNPYANDIKPALEISLKESSSTKFES